MEIILKTSSASQSYVTFTVDDESWKNYKLPLSGLTTDASKQVVDLTSVSEVVFFVSSIQVFRAFFAQFKGWILLGDTRIFHVRSYRLGATPRPLFALNGGFHMLRVHQDQLHKGR